MRFWPVSIFKSSLISGWCMIQWAFPAFILQKNFFYHNPNFKLSIFIGQVLQEHHYSPRNKKFNSGISANLSWLCVCGYIFFTISMRWHEERAITHLNNTIILWWYIGGSENQRLKLWCFHWSHKANQTKSFQAVMYSVWQCEKMASS